MHLVGDLSSVRLRDELVALLSEEDVEWSLQAAVRARSGSMRYTRSWPPTRTPFSCVKRVDELVKSWTVGGEMVTWRLRLAAMTRNMSHDELYLWLEQLKLKRST